MSSRVLVTGGAGYIGSHTSQQLLSAGYDVLVLDNLSTGDRELLPAGVHFIEGDIGDHQLVNGILSEGIDALLHFAGSIVVSESVADPLEYYHNNTLKTHGLLQMCVARRVDKVVFSSTATVYGDPSKLPLRETDLTLPVSPYATSKLMTEWMLRDTDRACGLRHIVLRYFNVAGADLQGRRGQVSRNATHLIKLGAEVLTGQRQTLRIFGDDYATPDGTGVRDYIHVTDLANAHVAALNYLMAGGRSQVLNCGYGRGSSVREVVSALERVAKRRIPTEVAPRRPGDVAELVADITCIKQVLDWQPQYDDLDLIVKSALDWERKRVMSHGIGRAR